MPIYDYHCNHCDCDFEYLKLSVSDPEPQCPSCCGSDITLKMSTSSFRPGGTSANQQRQAKSCRPSGG